MAVRLKSPAIAALVEKIRPYLRAYLEEQKIDIVKDGWMRCVNPDHNDSSPSMHLDPHVNEERAKCFSCGYSLDIFKAATILEDKPESGPGWVYENVYYLAKKFGISFEAVDPTPEELLFMQLASMYDDADDALTTFAKTSETYVAPALARGLTQQTCITYGVASVAWEEFAAAMVQNGHNLDLCRRFGIDEDMFNRDRLTFSLRDVSGMCVGFARRYLPYTKEQASLAKLAGRSYPVKYKNTSSDVPFYDKSTFVYGLDTAKKHNNSRLELYEGYGDVLMAKQVGIMASAASCGTSITEGQIDAMVAAGFKRINIVYDNEPQGQMASFSNLSKFGGREGLYLSVMFLPFEENVPLPERDPDTFLRTHGKDAYFEVKPITAFDQRLNCLIDAGLNGLQVAEDMVKLIVNEPSKVRQGEMIQTLSTRTGVKEEDIRNEITRITDKRVLSITETLSKRLALSRDARERIDLIKNSTLELGQFNEEKDADPSFEESAMAFQTTCSKFEKAVDGIGGWDTGWKFFNESFDGLPKNGQIIGVPGASNCGKSAWITTLATNLLQKNPDGPVVVFHSLDDPRETAFAKLLSCVTGLPIRFITRVAKYGTADKAVKETYEKAKAWVLQCMAEKRLVVKGQEIGNGTKVTQKLIDQAHAISGRNIVYVGDSLHSLDDQASHDERVKFKRVAEWTMMMTETRPLTMVFTVELRKAGMQGRPKLADLAESGKLIYAMKAIGFFYSELHDLRQAAKKFWVDSGRDPSTNMVLPPVKRPIIEVDWIKNKVTEFKGLSHLKLYDHVARVEELTDQDLTKELEGAKTLMNERTESNFAPGAAVRRPQNVFFSPLPAGKNGN